MQLNKTQETPSDSDIAKLVDFIDKEIVILTVLPYNWVNQLPNVNNLNKVSNYVKKLCTMKIGISIVNEDYISQKHAENFAS
ncbi:hypothetical protein EB796_018476 [Bugula neritina]|uniref:Uncharacterized protein n=1 Tax=Bugula neritina TaxID=10212 RepID=A0A7J7JB60_BUGNE|nr:hypothetical protein EB796_018476 [Bugula neritina]